MPTKKSPSAPHLVILAALTIVPAAHAQAVCDRECLGVIMSRYLDAMVAHDPSSLPVAANVKSTEDAKEMKLGEGAWKTVTKLRPIAWISSTCSRAWPPFMP